MAMLTVGGEGTVHRGMSRTNDSGGGPDGGDRLARMAGPRVVTPKRPRRCHRTEKNDDIKPSLAADRLMTDESMTLDQKSGRWSQARCLVMGQRRPRVLRRAD